MIIFFLIGNECDFSHPLSTRLIKTSHLASWYITHRTRHDIRASFSLYFWPFRISTGTTGLRKRNRARGNGTFCGMGHVHVLIRIRITIVCFFDSCVFVPLIGFIGRFISCKGWNLLTILMFFTERGPLYRRKGARCVALTPRRFLFAPQHSISWRQIKRSRINRSGLYNYILWWNRSIVSNRWIWCITHLNGRLWSNERVHGLFHGFWNLLNHGRDRLIGRGGI